jgi:Reverse transcriptase (RNA-dependent DNA polymerase)
VEGRTEGAHDSAYHPIPDGSFDKYKARLVAGGDMQDKKLFEDVSPPTVSTSSVFAIAAIAAHEERHVVVVDIGSAFLYAEECTGLYEAGQDNE